MPLDPLWNRYAATWSLAADDRGEELAACLSDDVTYCDPQGLVAGRPALSDYMGQFQNAFPGTRFQIESVLQHHDRTLASWTLRGAEDQLFQQGTSYAVVAADGRLSAITGFFEPPAELG
ncbi:MAG TPA: nuclear transport factor 2 family protein [Kineosporiaceae bacterium]|nr:nuclear transport factor 2 family protein [Kineosporiaceae bacterium]